jgi:DNA-binding response OmpR family regulator
MNRILVVDDEPDFVRYLTDVLRREEFHVSVAEDGVQALREAARSRPDLILLDWNLPQKDGLEVCRALKQDPATRDIPVIMLTARSRESDTVLGLEIGADDYVSKRGLRPRELTARVRTALRKAGPAAPAGEVYVRGALRIDVPRREATVDGAPVDLRGKEFDLLREFLRRPGHVLSRARIIEAVWGQDYFGTTRTVDTTVAYLRAKLGVEGRRIQSLKGLGYKFD